MIKDMNKFKEQCKDYYDFFNDIKLITKDYCLFYNKKNPLEMYSSYDDHIGLEIDEHTISIYWKEENYSCGSYETEFYNLTIPLDFYDKIEELELKKKQTQEEIFNLTKTLKNIKDKEYKIRNELNILNKDLDSMKYLNKKYSTNINSIDISNKENELNNELVLLNNKIKEINNNINKLEKTI